MRALCLEMRWHTASYSARRADTVRRCLILRLGSCRYDQLRTVAVCVQPIEPIEHVYVGSGLSATPVIRPRPHKPVKSHRLLDSSVVGRPRLPIPLVLR